MNSILHPAREPRPLGCRVYYCDPTYQETGNRLTEIYLARLKELADKAGIPWRYAPLHQFLNNPEDAELHGQECPCHDCDAAYRGISSMFLDQRGPDIPVRPLHEVAEFAKIPEESVARVESPRIGLPLI